MITFTKMQIPFIVSTISQYSLVIIMTKEMVLREHEFDCAKHGT
jgi:hypothetical protein